MQPEAGGWFELTTDAARAGIRYRYRVDGDARCRIPASRFSPTTCTGRARSSTRAAYQWRDGGWRGRPWEEASSTSCTSARSRASGDFAGGDRASRPPRRARRDRDRADAARRFPGRRNWGYDGVLLFAPAPPRPARRSEGLVEACHARGLTILLDVVYNHFGPDGNYLHAIAPDFFTERHHTPWGAAIDLRRHDAAGRCAISSSTTRSTGSRSTISTGCASTPSTRSSTTAARHPRPRSPRRCARRITGRQVHLVLENDDNEARRLARRNGRPRLLHRAVERRLPPRAACARDRRDRRATTPTTPTPDRAARPRPGRGLRLSGRALALSRRRPRGEPSGDLPPTAFVSFLQNHDQIGNTPSASASPRMRRREAVHAAIAIVLLSPQIPLLFMGEEWASATAVLFFCDFDAELAEAVRKGRRREFAQYPGIRRPRSAGARSPTPTAESSFTASRLDWTARRARAACDLARLRIATCWRSAQREIVPRLLRDGSRRTTFASSAPTALRVEWRLGDGATLLCSPISARARCALDRPRAARRPALLAPSPTPPAVEAGRRLRRVLSDPAQPSRDELRSTSCATSRAWSASRPHHVDALGVVHEPDEETLARLIAAFGLPTEPARSGRRARRSRAAAPFGLAPVHVVAQEDPCPCPAASGLPRERTPVDGTAVSRTARALAGAADGAPNCDSRRICRPGITASRSRLAAAHAEIDLIVAPPSCHLPEGLQPGARSWGLTAQLYGAAQRAQLGHRRFQRPGAAVPAAPGRSAPRPSASTRCTRCSRPSRAISARIRRRAASWLELPLHRCDRRPRLCRGRSGAVLASGCRDRRGRATPNWSITPPSPPFKRPVLEALFSVPAARWRGSAAADFRAFQRERRRGAGRIRHVRGAARAFPGERRSRSRGTNGRSRCAIPSRPEVAAFARDHAERVEFFQFLQWQADRQLGHAAEPRSRARDRPLSRSRGRGEPARRRGLGRSANWSCPERRSARRPTR